MDGTAGPHLDIRMDRIQIRGGQPLHGRIDIAGAKNAALPLMAASLLTDAPLRLSNLPHLADITTFANVLGQHGVALHMDGGDRGGSTGRRLDLQAEHIVNTCAPYELVRRMRASVLVLGPLLARSGWAEVSLPGGCAIGTRPVDLHLRGLEALGAEIEVRDGYIQARAPRGLTGAEITFPKVSVGATENLLMAATLAAGETRLVNAAREPEISDLAHCLTRMGARIDGIGTDTLTIQGVARLHGADHAVIPDRIEAGTYAMAAAITDGDVTLYGASTDHLAAPVAALQRAGVALDHVDAGLRVRRAQSPLRPTDIVTDPYPGFPTDLQAQFMALMTVADGESRIAERIFENRFMHVPELHRMGAAIDVAGGEARVHGGRPLTGAPVMASDLRASAGLVLAGLAASGETVVNRVYHLDRGYERMEEKLAACGADVARMRGDG
jgi:UDP-N-acetylglucosamine 1-carboxyvinyltransferase